MDDARQTGTTRPLPAQLTRQTDTRDVLARADRQRRAKNLDGYLIVDVDAHHFETQSWGEIVDLPFRPDEAKRNILGRTAQRNFKL